MTARWIKPAASAGVLMAALLAPTACGNGKVTLEGKIETTRTYSDSGQATMNKPTPTCAIHTVAVRDWAGKILRVAKSTQGVGKLKNPDADLHNLVCTASYSIEVLASDIYTVTVVGAADESNSGSAEQVVDRVGVTTEVDLISYTYAQRS